MNEVAAVILVGGKSARMGRNKAMLPYKGKRLVDVVVDVVRQAGITKIYVSGEMEGYDSLPDLLAGRGPVGGICSSAVALHKTYASALFIPVDMPHITVEFLHMLMQEEKRAACHFEDHPLPCMIPLDSRTMRQVDVANQTLARNQELSVKSFLAGLEAQALPVPVYLEKALTNTNTPEQWQEAAHESAHQ